MPETNLSELLRSFDHLIRRQSRCVGRTVEQLDWITRVTGPTSASIDNMIIWSDLQPDTVDRVIDEQIDYFTDLGHGFQWFAYGHDQPDDLIDRLHHKGFVAESEDEVVIASAEKIAKINACPEGIEIRRITDSAGIADVVKVGDEVWGKSNHDFVTRWLTDQITLHPDNSVILAAYDGSKPVAGAWATAWGDQPFASLFGGSVLPDWRKRGIYHALIAERARQIAERGIQWCLVDAGPESRPILKTLGFQSLTQRFCMRREPA